MDSIFSDISIAWEDFTWQLAVAVFVAYAIVDALYAYYTIVTVKLKPFKSASTSFLMHFLLAFGVVNYTENFLYIFPLASGSFLGTYFMVKREYYKSLGLKGEM